MTRASSDSLPDMMNHWPTDTQFVQFEDEGLLLDLSEKDYMKNIDSKYLDAVKAKDGKNYMAPYNVNFMGVYYNKDKFEEAGYTMPTKWDELIALAEEIKAKGETPFILPNKDSWTVSNLWSNIEARDLGSHEDEFEKMKAGEESFETIPEYKSSVEKMIQLLDYANEDSLALGYDQAINDFANGEGWMFIQGSWTLPSFLSANPDFNVEFAVLPNDNGKPIATQTVDTGFCVNAKVADEPEKMEAIDKFLSFALSAEGAQIYTDNDKSPSCVTGVKAEVPQFQPFFDYVEANGFEADGAYPPTGFEDTKRVSLKTALSLIQIGEFSLAILELARSQNLIDTTYSQVLIITIVISMILTPIVLKNLSKAAAKLIPEDVMMIQNSHNFSCDMENHVIVLGYGKFGQAIVEEFKVFGQNYVILEHNIMFYQAGKARNEPIVFGNAAQRHILNSINITKASAVIVAVNNPDALHLICEAVNDLTHNSKTIVTVTNNEEKESLNGLHLKHIIVETTQIARAVVDEVMYCRLS